MTSAIWSILDKVKDAAATGDVGPSSRIDGMLNATMETVADILPSASADLLNEGRLVASLALITLETREQIDRQSVDFMAGRLAAIIDILGYAAALTANEDVVQTASLEPYASIVGHLASGAMRSDDLAKWLGADGNKAADYLAELVQMGIVTDHMRGLERFHDLSPLGSILADTAPRPRKSR